MEPSTATVGLDRYWNVALPSPHLAKVGLRGEDSRAGINEFHLGLWSVEHGSGIFLAELYICWGQAQIRWVGACVSHHPYFSPPTRQAGIFPHLRDKETDSRGKWLAQGCSAGWHQSHDWLIKPWIFSSFLTMWGCFVHRGVRWYPFWLSNWLCVKQGFSISPCLTSKHQLHFTMFPHVGITSYNDNPLACLSITNCASNVLWKTRVSFMSFPDKHNFTFGVNVPNGDKMNSFPF